MPGLTHFASPLPQVTSLAPLRQLPNKIWREAGGCGGEGQGGGFSVRGAYLSSSTTLFMFPQWQTTIPSGNTALPNMGRQSSFACLWATWDWWVRQVAGCSQGFSWVGWGKLMPEGPLLSHYGHPWAQSPCTFSLPQRITVKGQLGRHQRSRAQGEKLRPIPHVTSLA